MPSSVPLACLTCGYDLSGIEAGRCPECGRDFTGNDGPSMARLGAILREGDRIPRKQVIGWAGVVAVYAVGAGIMNGDAGFPALLLAGALLTIACVGSFALGSVVLIGCDRPRRLAAQDAWRRELWVLHLPWLVIAPGAVILLGVAFLLAATGGFMEDTLSLGGMALLCWIPCSFATPLMFMRRVRQRLDACRSNTPGLGFRLWIGALVVMVGAMALGFGGGLLARHGASEMAGLKSVADGF